MELGDKVELENPKVHEVVNIVKEYIIPYEIEVNPLFIKFNFLDSDNPLITKKFAELSRALMDKGYVPQLVNGYEHYVNVSIGEKRKFVSNKVNLIMLILTILSTIYAGYYFSGDFIKPGSDVFWRTVFYGFIFFTLPLLTILGVHEFGHFIVARHYKVRASLPFFIPFIPLAYSIGTFGAFISLRDPFPNRKVMTNIGAAGPIAGFATAFPLLFVANYLQKIMPKYSNFTPYFLHYPYVYHVLGLSMPVTSPFFPMTISVWVGIFATALNLFPVGQLDGGHIVRGMMGKKAIYLSYFFIIVLFYLGLSYTGWLLIAILVMFLGLNHPPALDDTSPIGALEIGVGVLVLILFLLSFTPIPIYL
jgi:membrane-associated protease RseP (regulator of RpoE activity)